MRPLAKIRIVAVAPRASSRRQLAHHLLSLGEFLKPSAIRPLIFWASEGMSNFEFEQLFNFKNLAASDAGLWTIIGFNDGERNPVPRCFDTRWPHVVDRGQEFRIPIIGRNSSIKLRCTNHRGKYRSVWTAFVPDDYPFAYFSTINS